jgi:DNA-binding IclR family transcriptional regulator
MKPKQKQPAVVKVNSVANALAVLRRLAVANRPEGVSAIARSVGISPSSCFNILKTLAAEEFAHFDSEYKTYALGSGAVDLAVAALDPEAGFLRTRLILEGLAREYSVTCGLWRRVRDRLILLGAAEGQEIARIRFSPGQRLPSMIGAMGRCVVARSDLPESELAKAISALKWDNPPTFDRYLSEVRQAAVNGFAIDDGNFLHGITSVAAAVISREGSLTHCIAATTFKGRFDSKELRVLGQAVKKASEAAAGLLGSVR